MTPPRPDARTAPTPQNGETAMYQFVKGDRVRTTVDAGPAWPGAFDAPAGTLATVDSLPKPPGDGYGVILDGDPDGLPSDFKEEELELVTFEPGDKILCPDSSVRTVERMAIRTPGEVAHVLTEGGSRLPVAMCVHANREDILDAHRRCNAAGERVRTDPDPDNPEWRAALDRLTAALAFLRLTDPTVRVALAEEDARKAVQDKHPDAHDFQPVVASGQDGPLGWTYRVGYGAHARYSGVTFDGDVNAYGLYVYRSKVERAFLYG
ncbi:hypothetical protein [Streptomyces sp. TRM68367]|uniref:hypothetical protein n=1 Tax=Streptomyces sp. TRM68367 TaxID=2758415 RepID=UPI00165BB062|nr:hypothetical protein [Streptomyces sp. TRM68367]MBC9730704.1 hypothetical protein [Streptomyces sp. TRM68367]